MALISHHRLDGDATDATGRFNGSTASFVSTSGKLDGAVNMTSSSTITFDTPISYDYSISFWVKLKSNFTGSYRKFLQKSSDRSPGFWFYNTSNRLHLRQRLSINTNAGADTTTSLVVGTWYHVVFSCSVTLSSNPVTTLRSYLDGNIEGTSIAFGEIPDPQGTTIDLLSTDYDVDDVRVYDHALSLKEVKELAKAKLAHYKFDDPIVNNSDQDIDTSIIGTATLSELTPVGFTAYDSGAGNNSVRLQGDINPANFTVAFWLWISPSQTWASRFDVLSGTSTGGAGRLLFYRLDATTLRFHCQYNATARAVDIAGANTTFTNNWAHVVLVSSDQDNSDVLEVYVNGVSVGSTTSLSQSYNFTNSDLYLMSDRGVTNWTNGRIADLRLYNTILSQSDIDELYQKTSSIDNHGNLHVNHIDNVLNYDATIDANNLQLNGSGELGDTTGWPSGFTYEGSGVFQKTSSTSTDLVPEIAYIPIRGNGRDRFDQYKISCEIQHVDQTSNYYFMTACYDKYKQRINNEHVNIWADRATTITATLNNGATTVQFADVSNWFDNGVPGYVNGKSFSIWVAGDDPIYVPLKYSRRWVQYSDIDKINHTVTLVSSWSGGTIASGTLVANSQSGGTYSYIGASNIATTASWVYREGTTSAGAEVGNTRFATEYIGLGWLLNRNAAAPPSTTQIRNVRMWHAENNQNPIYFVDKIKANTLFQTKEINEIGPTNGMMLYLPFTEDTSDHSEYSRSTSATAVTRTSGVNDAGAYTFNGTSSTVDITDFSFPSVWTSPFAVACWIYVPTGATWANGFYSTIVGRGSYNGAHGLIKNTTDNSVGIIARGDAAIRTAFGTVTRDTWHHIVGVWNGDQATLYINGASVASSSTGGNTGVPDAGVWRVGGALAYSGNTGAWFEGTIDDVRIYDRDISSQDVALLYKSTMPVADTQTSITPQITYVRGEIKE